MKVDNQKLKSTLCILINGTKFNMHFAVCLHKHSGFRASHII